MATSKESLRVRVSEIENPGRTQFCAECEQRAKRIAELKAQLNAMQEELDNLNSLHDDLDDQYITLTEHVYVATRKALPNKRPHSPYEAVDELEAALAEARKDGERLDYLERDMKAGRSDLFICYRYFDYQLFAKAFREKPQQPKYTTIRAAIDAAKEEA